MEGLQKAEFYRGQRSNRIRLGWYNLVMERYLGLEPQVRPPMRNPQRGCYVVGDVHFLISRREMVRKSSNAASSQAQKRIGARVPEPAVD